MTYENFIINIKNYYGEYKKYVEVCIIEYLIQNFDESELEKLQKIVFMNYSNQYRTPPDIAVISSIIENYNMSNKYTIQFIPMGEKKLLEQKELLKQKTKEIKEIPVIKSIELKPIDFSIPEGYEICEGK